MSISIDLPICVHRHDLTSSKPHRFLMIQFLAYFTFYTARVQATRARMASLSQEDALSRITNDKGINCFREICRAQADWSPLIALSTLFWLFLLLPFILTRTRVIPSVRGNSSSFPRPTLLLHILLLALFLHISSSISLCFSPENRRE